MESPARKMGKLTQLFVEKQNKSLDMRMDEVYKTILWFIEIVAAKSEDSYYYMSIESIKKNSCLKTLTNNEIEYLLNRLKADEFKCDTNGLSGTVSGEAVGGILIRWNAPENV